MNEKNWGEIGTCKTSIDNQHNYCHYFIYTIWDLQRSLSQYYLRVAWITSLAVPLYLRFGAAVWLLKSIWSF